MKSYTDIKQSKKLTEILPLDTADMYWLNRHIDLTETKYEIFIIDKSDKYIDFFKSYAVSIDNNEIIPCWSLGALLEVLNMPALTQNNDDDWDVVINDLEYPDEYIEVHGSNPVDVCVEMILKFRQKILS